MRIIINSFLLIAVHWSCNVNKINGFMCYNESNELKIEQAFIQEEIPGTLWEKSRFYATILIEPFTDSTILLDSIVYISSTFSEVKMTARTSIKFEIQVRDNSLKMEEECVDRATVYFKKDKQNYRQVIPEFLIKDPIYLP